jgi:pimeloyl-ACP methyl ester carboxylesterase
MHEDTVELEIDGVTVTIAVLRRDGLRTPLVFLHGFGSTKEDYADIALRRRFDGHAVLAFDAPGLGASRCAQPACTSIDFLKQTAARVIAHYGLERLHLVGHSMGGLTALLLARELSDAVVSFVNIEGNLASEDCFLSRQIVEHPSSDSVTFLERFAERTRRTPGFSMALYASALESKVSVDVVAPIFRSMVEISETTPLLDAFLALPCPKMFMHGDADRALAYLGALHAGGVKVCEIAECGHFPMYANAFEMWARIADFVERVEQEGDHG